MRIFAMSTTTPKATLDAIQATMVEEIAKGKQFVEQGLILEAYMDTTYTNAYMILEAPSVEAAKAAFDTYPAVQEGLIAFAFTPLVGMPAVSESLTERGLPLPAWWPQES